MSWIDDIGKEEFFKGMADAIKGGTTPGKVEPIDPKKTEKEFKEFIKNIKESNSNLKMYQTAMEGGQVPVIDLSENIKNLDKAIEESTDTNEKETLKEKRRMVMREQMFGALKATSVNLATGFAKAAYGLVLAGLDLTKGIIEGQSAISVATNAQIAQIQAQAKMLSTIGEALNSLTFLVQLLPIGRALKIVLTLVTGIIGPLLKLSAEKSAELAEKGLRILEAQAQQVRKGFYQMGMAGVQFTEGMSGMTKTATRAGLRVEDFASAVGESADNIIAMGMGLGAGVQRLAGISGEIRKGNLGLQLRNLGFDLKDQAKVAAAAAAQLNYSGQLRTMSDREVAKYTVQYAKDLKVLQGLVGADAEKKLEQARKEALAADVRAKLLREGGPQALANFEKVFVTVPESIKKGFLENIASGGTAIADVTTNVLMAAEPAVKEYLDASRKIILNSKPEEIVAKSGKILETLGQAGLKSNSMLESITMAGRFANDSLTQGVGQAFAEITEIGIKHQTGATEASKKIVEGAAVTKDALTQATHRLDDKVNKIAVLLQERMIPGLTRFANANFAAVESLDSMMAAITAQLNKMGIEASEIKNKATDDKNREHMFFGEMTRSYSKQAAASVVGLFSEKTAASMEKNRRAEESAQTQRREGSVKQEVANREKMTFGEKTASDMRYLVEDLVAFFGASGTAEKMYKDRIAAETQNLKKSESDRGFWKNLTGFSRGGVSNRPAIFGEKGPEAAVPLPDGRTIPVTLKGIDKIFQATMKSLDPMGITDKNIKIPPGLRQEYESLFAKLTPPQAAVSQSQQSLAVGSRLTGMDFGTNTRKDEDRKAFNDDMKSLLGAQLDKQDAMIKALRENIAVNQRILAAAS